MRKKARIICLVLSVCMFANLAGFEVLAADGEDQMKAMDSADIGSGEGTEKSASDKTKDNGQTEEISSDEEKIEEGAQETPGDEGPNTPDQPETPLPEENPDNSTDITPAGDTENNQDVPKDGQEEEPSQEEETPAGVVDGITAKPADASGSKLHLSWNPVEGAVKYEVEVLSYTDLTLVNKQDTQGTELTVEVTRGEKYYLSVKAVKEDGTESAAGRIPAILLAAPSVTADTEDTAIKFSWKTVAGADKYQVEFEGKTEDVTGTSYQADNLEKGKKYNFSVQAVCVFEENGKTYTYVSEVTKITAATATEKPDKVKELTGMDGDKSAILTWSKTAGAESYAVYRYDASGKKWQVVAADIKKLTYTDKNLKEGKTYKYRVAAVNAGGSGEQSSTVAVSVKKSPGKIRTIGYKAVVKSKAPLFLTKKGKKRVKYLKPGTKVTTIDYGNRRYQIRLSDGKLYWLSKDRLSFRASIWTTKDYSTKAKEDFVNKKGYKSPTKYLIWISQYTQRVVIYKGSKGKWKVIRSGRCATGTHKYMTPKGVLYITYKEKGWFYKDRYEKPVVRFKSGNAFHSRIKSYKGGYVDATIGRPKSHGCVRLYDEDINFIYKNCPKGTTVISY